MFVCNRLNVSKQFYCRAAKCAPPRLIWWPFKLIGERIMRARKTRHSRGIAAIELALTLPFILTILAFVTLLGSVMYKYEVATKATHDATRYLSSISKLAMKNPDQIAYHTAVARALIDTELSAISTAPYAPSVTILCGSTTSTLCDGFTLPSTVTVTIRLKVANQLLPEFTSAWLGSDIVLTASATMAYLGV